MRCFRGHMHNIPGLERLPLAALDRRPAYFISGRCLPVDNLAADYDRCLAGLYDNQIRLSLVPFRLATTCLASRLEEQVIPPVTQRLARKPVLYGLVQNFFARSELLGGPMIVTGGNCRSAHE